MKLLTTKKKVLSQQSLAPPPPSEAIILLRLHLLWRAAGVLNHADPTNRVLGSHTSAACQVRPLGLMSFPVYQCKKVRNMLLVSDCSKKKKIFCTFLQKVVSTVNVDTTCPCTFRWMQFILNMVVRKRVSGATSSPIPVACRKHSFLCTDAAHTDKAPSFSKQQIISSCIRWKCAVLK